jgi:hypothetical protein
MSITGEFSGNPATATMNPVNMQCGNWTHICAKDEQHTLSDMTTLSIIGDEYQADTSLSLKGADTDNDDIVDINDVTWLIHQYSDFASDADCPWNGMRDADFSNNGIVGSEDYGFISSHWLEWGACDCGRTQAIANGGCDGKQRPAGRRRSLRAVTVHRSLVGKVDLNEDGLVDFRDVQLLEEREGLGHSLSSKMAGVGGAGGRGNCEKAGP